VGRSPQVVAWSVDLPGRRPLVPLKKKEDSSLWAQYHGCRRPGAGHGRRPREAAGTWRRCGETEHGAEATLVEGPAGDRGWTVFQLPATPWVNDAVRSDIYGLD